MSVHHASTSGINRATYIGSSVPSRLRREACPECLRHQLRRKNQLNADHRSTENRTVPTVWGLTSRPKHRTLLGAESGCCSGGITHDKIRVVPPAVAAISRGARTMSEAVQNEPECVEDLGKLIAYIDEKLPPSWPEWPGGWPDQIEAALLDAVLSIRARYGSENTGVRAAVRRYKKFVGDDRPNSLSRLAGFDPTELGEVLRNRQVTGGASKATAVVEAAKRLNEAGVERAADIPVAGYGDGRTQEQEVRLERLKAAYTAVPGLGKVTFAYFTMLVGEPGVKADTWLGRFVAEAVGRRVSSDYTEQCVKDAAEHYGVDPRVLDHAIWVYMRTRSSEEDEE